MHLVTMGTRPFLPSAHRSFIQFECVDNRLGWAPIRQQGDHDHDQFLRFAQSRTHRSLPRAKGLLAGPTPIAWSLPAMNDNISLPHLASCWTLQIGAKYPGSIHLAFCLWFHSGSLPDVCSPLKSFSLALHLLGILLANCQKLGGHRKFGRSNQPGKTRNRC